MAKIKFKNLGVVFNNLTDIQSEVLKQLVSDRLDKPLIFNSSYITFYDSCELEDTLSGEYLYIKARNNTIDIDISRIEDCFSVDLDTLLDSRSDGAALEHQEAHIKATGMYSMRLRKMITDRFLSKPNVTLTVENIVDCAREVYGELFDSPFIDIIYEENDPGNYILL